MPGPLHLLLLFAVYSVGPGFFFVRRLRLSPSEKLVTSVALSRTSSSTSARRDPGVRRPPDDRPAGPPAGSAHRARGRQLPAHPRVNPRPCAAAEPRAGPADARRVPGLFLLWGFVLLSMIRSYGGGTWSADWLEDYQRATFFVGNLPREYLFLDKFSLPAARRS